MSQMKLPVRFDDFLHDLILWKLQGDTRNKVLNLSGESLRSFHLFGKDRVAPEGKDLLLSDTVLVDLSHNEINGLDDLFLVAPNTWWLNLAHNQKLNIPIKGNMIEELSLPLAFGSLNFSRNAINLDYLSIFVNTHIIRLYISLSDLVLKQRYLTPTKARALVLSKLANVWILNDEFICWEERQFLNSLAQGHQSEKKEKSTKQVLPAPVTVEMTDTINESSGTKKKEITAGMTPRMTGSRLASLFSGHWKVRSSGIKEGQFLTSIQNCSWSSPEDMNCFRLDIALDDYLTEAHLSNEAGLAYVSKGKSFPVFDVQKLFNLPHALQLDLSIIFSAMLLVQQVPYSLLLDIMIIMLGPYMTQQEINDLMNLPGFVQTALICTLRRKVLKDYQVLSYQSGKVNQEALPGALFRYDFVSTQSVMEYLKTEPKEYVKKTIPPFSQIELEILQCAPLIVTPYQLKQLKSVNNAAVTTTTNAANTEHGSNNWFLFICSHTIHLLKLSAYFPTVNQMHSSVFEEMVPLIKGAGMNYVDFFSYAEMNANKSNLTDRITHNNNTNTNVSNNTVNSNRDDDDIDVGSTGLSEAEEYDVTGEIESKGDQEKKRQSPKKYHLDISQSISKEADEMSVGDTISGIVGDMTGLSLALSEEDVMDDMRMSPYNKVVGPQGLSMHETGSVMRQSLRDLKEISVLNTMEKEEGHYKYYSKKPRSAGGPRRIYAPPHDNMDMEAFNTSADTKKAQNKVGVYTANNMVESMFLVSSRKNLLASKEFNQLEDKSPANLLLHKPPVIMEAYNFKEMANQHAKDASASMASGEEEAKYGTFPTVTLSNTNDETKRRDSLDLSIPDSVSSKSTVSLATATRDMLAEMGTLRNIRNMMSPQKLKQNMKKSIKLDLAALNLSKSHMKNKYTGPGGDTPGDNDEYQDMPFYESKESMAARSMPRVKTTGMLRHIASMLSPVDDVKMKSRYLNVYTEPREGEFGVQYGLKNVDSQNVTSDWHPVPKKPVFRVSPEQVHKKQMFADVRIRPQSESAATRRGKQRDDAVSFGKYFDHFPVRAEDFQNSIITGTSRLEFDTSSGMPLPVHYSATHSLQMNTNFKSKRRMLPKDARRTKSTKKNKHIYNI